jgi:hypothetical protein
VWRYNPGAANRAEGDQQMTIREIWDRNITTGIAALERTNVFTKEQLEAVRKQWEKSRDDFLDGFTRDILGKK